MSSTPIADQMPTSDVPVCQAAGYTVHSVLWFGTSGKAECYVSSVSALGQQDWARPALNSGGSTAIVFINTDLAVNGDEVHVLFLFKP